MLKRIPYNSNLISIGNVTHNANEPVWSDGQVVYGRVRESQLFVPVISPGGGGYWVGEEVMIISGLYGYQLCKKDLTLDTQIQTETSHGDVQCYPAYATIDQSQTVEKGYIYKGGSCYPYEGGIVSIDGNGNALIYAGYALHFLSFGPRKKDAGNRDLYVARHVYVYNEYDYCFYDGTYYSISGDITYIYDSDMVQIATYNKQDGTVHSNVYNGQGSITIEEGFALYEPNDTTVNLDSLRSMDTYNVIYAIDGFRPNGPSGNTPVEYWLTGYGNSADVRKYFQLATPQDCRLTANTPDRDNDGRLIYNGTYTIHLTVLIVSGSGKMTENQYGYKDIYDANMNRVAMEFSGGSIDVYNPPGSVLPIYRGQGKIDVYNKQDTGTTDTGGNEIYTCDYVICKPLSTVLTGSAEMKINGNNITVMDSNDNIIAQQSGSNVTVYENGTTVYDGPGSITTSNLTPIEWTCDYDIRRDITGNGYIDAVGSTTYQDQQGNWHIEGGTIKIYDNTFTLFAEGPGPGSVGQTTIYNYTQPYWWQGDGWIEADSSVSYVGTDQQGNPVFSGGYTIRRDISGSGIYKNVGNDIYLYDSNHVNLIAKENGMQVIVYDSQGQITYQGSGYIDVSNTSPYRYSGNYSITAGLDGQTGNGKIIDKDDDIYAYTNNMSEIAHEEDSIVDIGGYRSYGYIETANLSPQLSIKQYYINPTAQQQISLESYPQTLQLGVNAELNLSNMALTVGGYTYGNDPLGLYNSQDIVYAGGVHADKDFIISQDGTLIWHADASTHTVNSQVYSGISKCFSLAWIKKWIV